MPYIIYGKRITDKRFAPLDYMGHRMSGKSEAYMYPTKESAEDRLKEAKTKEGVVLEIRKVK